MTIRDKLKKSAGFIMACVLMLIFGYFSVDLKSLTAAFWFLATLFAVEFAQKNALSFWHMVAIFFWAFYVYFDPQGTLLEKPYLFFASSLFFGMVTAFVPKAFQKIK